MTVAITDVVLRDAHQSLFATRLRLDDMLPIAAQLDDVGYGSLECWGGATFDACIRFLGEDPWLRLRELKKAMPKTPLQMLLRARTCSATATTPMTWWNASSNAPSKTAWTCSASSMP
ncbi:Oxaloacetate decarboxylase alpha chain [Salmonella enterica subsp. enterica serovar Typhimurium str. DT104]|nr:Oxaloacetate decarboxylase alpha chain [Salmonella enterica subsp. enterica serovar Typhimurium str. DT104]